VCRDLFGGHWLLIGPISAPLRDFLFAGAESGRHPVWQLYFGGLISFAVVAVRNRVGWNRGLLDENTARWLEKAGHLGTILPQSLPGRLPWPTLAMVAGLILAIETIVHFTVIPAERLPHPLVRRQLDAARSVPPGQCSISPGR